MYRQHRSDFGDTPNGKRFDEINDTAKGIVNMIAQIDRGVKPQKRFQGQLKFLHSPHLLGADMVGILAKIGGGDVTVRWEDINSVAMDQIFELATPERADEFRKLLADRVRLTEQE